MKLPRWLARHTLWAGFAAVLVPLAVLLAVQYRWLAQLEGASRVTHQATLRKCLDTVAEKVESFYQEKTKWALDVPAADFTAGRYERIAYHFKKHGIPEAGRLFVYELVLIDGHAQDFRLLYYDPATATLEKPMWSDEVRAVYAAASPLELIAHKGGKVRAVLEAQERDGRLLLLYPVTDDAWNLVAVTGMIVDTGYFRDRLLPEVIGHVVPSYVSDYGLRGLAVTVRDGKDRLALTWPPKAEPPSSHLQVERALPFVFKDWKIGLGSRRNTPAHLARRSFVLNAGLAALLSAALVGGIVLALRTASREVKLSQMKSDFVSNVSHELRTPLASIRVFGEFLRLGRFEGLEKAREYGEYIETESRRLTQLINNLLDFASIEKGRKSYRLESADVAEVVADTLKTFEVRLRQSGFRIAYTGPEGPLPPVRLEPGALAQALSNLLDNAVKYSNGGRDIEVALRRREGYVVLSVRDQGIGIPRDEQKKIFDRFHRVSTGLVHDVKGSGLGLAIVRHVAEAHGGWVSVESRPGEGSTFSIHLPVEPGAAPAPVPPAAAPRPSEA